MPKQSPSIRSRVGLVLTAVTLVSFGVAQPGVAFADDTSAEASPLVVGDETGVQTPETVGPAEPEGDLARTSPDPAGPETLHTEPGRDRGNNDPSIEPSQEPGSAPDASDSLDTEEEDPVTEWEHMIAEIEVGLSEVRQGQTVPVVGRCALLGYTGIAGRVNMLPLDESNYYDFPAVALSLDSEGYFDEGIPIPGDMPTGDYNLRFSCSDDDATFGSTAHRVSVLQGEAAPPVTTPNPENTNDLPAASSAATLELANTGGGTHHLLVPAAITALIAGGSLLGASRRLRR